MRIDARTGELLREFWKVVEPALPKLLDGFYQHITKEPQLARLVGGDIPRLKAAQGTHWARLFNGRFDLEYMKGVRTNGHVHNKIGLEPRWYMGGYNFVLSQLVALAVRKYRWKPDHLSAILTATNCAVMLDMDMAAFEKTAAQSASDKPRRAGHQDPRHEPVLYRFGGRLPTDALIRPMH